MLKVLSMLRQEKLSSTGSVFLYNGLVLHLHSSMGIPV